ncbi:MAG: YggS family pyridoxal phosphate-dependent enzyme [Spirochaetales bacterium]
MSEHASIRDNILNIQDKINLAAMRSGRNAEDITLMAVTKFQPYEAVMQAYEAGVRRFGENRVQEAERKYSIENIRTMPEFRLDMIGRLQGNKINKALALFDCIQSIGSIDTLDAIISRAEKREKPLDLLFEMHTGEESKAGFPDIDKLLEAVERYLFLLRDNGSEREDASIRLVGLMTMAPFTANRQEIQTSFRKLSKAKDEVNKRFSLKGFGQLSMGMSGDFEIAIEEGATIVRIGTAIFGARQ